MATQQEVEAGQAVYSKSVLALYDWWVLGFSNRLLWRCPTKLLRSEFSELASDNHLDVGVGTGYYPDKCLSNSYQRLGLLDLNANSLAVAAKRCERFQPEQLQANVLEPLSIGCDKFDSVSFNFLLHCLPGNITEKASTFAHVKSLLNPDAQVFGSTILGTGVKPNKAAKKLMSLYNKKGIFSNSEDNVDDLGHALNQHFKDVSLRVIGCVAIFRAIV
ncbi:MAG: methyltransferase [Alteromonadaceae bacterium]|nr:methyltransferase [Alteromonadaceae bacterium]